MKKLMKKLTWFAILISIHEQNKSHSYSGKKWPNVAFHLSHKRMRFRGGGVQSTVHKLIKWYKCMYVYLNWQYIFKAPPDAVMNMLQLISQEEVQEYFKKFFEYFKKPQASKTFLRNELPGHVQSNVSTISFLCNLLILIKKCCRLKSDDR